MKWVNGEMKGTMNISMNGRGSDKTIGTEWKSKAK